MTQSTFNAWSIAISIATGIIILASAVIAIRNLGIIAKANRISAYEAFTERWESVHSERLMVLEEFDFNPDSPPELDSEIGQTLRKVINCFNEIGLMIDRRMLPAQYVLGLCYPDFIRCYYRLQSYLEYREAELGVRYGRRMAKMAQRARNYHDARAHNRPHPVRVRARGSSKYITVYQTYVKSGFPGVLQRCAWLARRISGSY